MRGEGGRFTYGPSSKEVSYLVFTFQIQIQIQIKLYCHCTCHKYKAGVPKFLSSISLSVSRSVSKSTHQPSSKQAVSQRNCQSIQPDSQFVSQPTDQSARPGVPGSGSVSGRTHRAATPSTNVATVTLFLWDKVRRGLGHTGMWRRGKGCCRT